MGTQLACVLVLLSTAQFVENSSATSTCLTYGIQSQVMYMTMYETQTICCDTWCNTYCMKPVAVQTSFVGYVQAKICCEGYGGPDCNPVCLPACGFNGECISPGNCTCIKGWTGSSCRQVAGYRVTKTTSSSITLSWVVPENASTSETYTYYQVTCSPQKGGPSLTAAVSDSENSITVSPLQDSEPYQCCITPVFFGQEGIKSCIDTITIGNGVLVTTDQEQLTLSLLWLSSMNSVSTSYTLSLFNISTQTMPVKSWNISTIMPNITDVLYLEPYIPYSFEVEADLENQTLLLSSAVFFVRETVPASPPVINTAEHLSPESITIQWDPLTLSDSRGFVVAYVVEYSESVVSCSYAENEKYLNTTEHSIILNNLDLQKDYCVSVAALTSAGIGPFSNYVFIPIFNNNFFRVEVSGVSDCSKWVAESTSTKTADLVSELIKVINTKCQNCQFSTDQFGLLQFLCEGLQTSSNFTSLQGRIVGNNEISSTEVIDLLQQWVNTSPVVLIGGGRFKVTAECSVLIDNIGSSLCTNTSQVSTVGSNTGDSSTLGLAITALVISFVAITLLVFGFTVFLCLFRWGSRRGIPTESENIKM